MDIGDYERWSSVPKVFVWEVLNAWKEYYLPALRSSLEEPDRSENCARNLRNEITKIDRLVRDLESRLGDWSPTALCKRLAAENKDKLRIGREEAQDLWANLKTGAELASRIIMLDMTQSTGGNHWVEVHDFRAYLNDIPVKAVPRLHTWVQILRLLRPGNESVM